MCGVSFCTFSHAWWSNTQLTMGGIDSVLFCIPAARRDNFDTEGNLKKRNDSQASCGVVRGVVFPTISDLTEFLRQIAANRRKRILKYFNCLWAVCHSCCYCCCCNGWLCWWAGLFSEHLHAHVPFTSRSIFVSRLSPSALPRRPAVREPLPRSMTHLDNQIRQWTSCMGMKMPRSASAYLFRAHPPLTSSWNHHLTCRGD